jgi:hypothetical protein
MPNTHPLMRLSHDEEIFLRHWMYDEVHYQERIGPAKRLQRQHEVAPADLAILIAAAIPDLAEQERAGRAAPAEPPTWPWSEETLSMRLAEARATLAERACAMGEPGGAPSRDAFARGG